MPIPCSTTTGLITPCGTPRVRHYVDLERELGRDVELGRGTRRAAAARLEAEFGLRFERELATAPLLAASR